MLKNIKLQTFKTCFRLYGNISIFFVKFLFVKQILFDYLKFKELWYIVGYADKQDGQNIVSCRPVVVYILNRKKIDSHFQ